MASAQNGAASQRGAKHRRAALTPAAWGGRSMKAALAVLVMLVAAFASAENFLGARCLGSTLVAFALAFAALRTYY